MEHSPANRAGSAELEPKHGAIGRLSADEELQQSVCEALIADPSLDSRDIGVRVAGDTVVLSGSVQDASALERAVRIAQAQRGVEFVRTDELACRDASTGAALLPECARRAGRDWRRAWRTGTFWGVSCTRSTSRGNAEAGIALAMRTLEAQRATPGPRFAWSAARAPAPAEPSAAEVITIMTPVNAGCLSLAAALALSAFSAPSRADSAPTLPEPEPARATGVPGTKTAPSKKRNEPRARAVLDRRRAPAPGSARAPGRIPELGAARSSPFTPPPLAALERAPLEAGTPPSSPERSEARPMRLEPRPATSPAAPPSSSSEALPASSLFRGNGPLELIGSIVLPATRGVTIAQIEPEGAPAVSFTVRPTKITRGSGLVATGKF